MSGLDEAANLALLGGVCAVLAIVSLWAAARALRRRKPLRAGTLGLGTGGFALIAALFGSLALNLHTYQRFTLEQDIAHLHFAQRAPQLFDVQLLLADGTARRTELAGDEWQLDARVLKWSGLATVLGFQPVYRLERLSGRYYSTEQELNGRRTVEELATRRGLDLWSSARVSQQWIPWVDAVYGSAAYLPMRDGAHFKVTVTHNGLLARPVNETAIKAVADWD